MRQIRLNGTKYTIKGEITKRAISPWMAKVSSGSREYSDFTSAQLEEYHDFRNGIGLESATPADSNRTWFTEGIDFTTPRKAVLGPLVTTAGSVGSAPIKILDFQGKTYVICTDGTVKVWNVLASEWEHAQYTTLEDCEDAWNYYQNPNATHALDNSDYKVGSGAVKITVDSSTTNEMLAEETISSIDLSAYTRIRAWIKSQLATASGDLQFHLGPVSTPTWSSPTGFSDPSTAWSDEGEAYDEDTASYTFTTLTIDNQAWSAYLHLTIASMLSDTIRYYDNSGAPASNIEIYVNRDGGWVEVFTGALARDNTWKEKTFAPGLVTEVRIRIQNNTGGTTQMYFYEFDFGKINTQAINVPALTADTWTRVIIDIPTPADLTAVTRVGIKAVAEVASGDIIRIDDLQVEKEEAVTDIAPIDAIVITDSNDEWLIVSTMEDAHYWAGGDTDEWAELIDYHEGHSTNDPDSYWSGDANLIDNDTTTSISKTNIGNGIWSSYFEVIENPSQRIDRIRYFIHSTTGADVDQIDIDVEYDNAWVDVYEGAFTENEWVVKELVDHAAHDVTKIRIRAHANGAATDDVYISGLQWGAGPSEHMVAFGNRLYWMGRNGSSVNFSAVGDITLPGDHWTITGNVGTVYKLFEGKLLADGTPILYFCGTLGLYTLDLTNEIAYKQEVEYPPLTYAGHSGMYWNGSVYVTTGFGILKVTPSLATYIGPDQDDGLPSTYQGSIFDMTTVNNWLVYCVNGGSSDKSSILKRNSSYGGSLQVYTTSAIDKPIACLHHSPSSLYANGRLWFGEGTDVKYMPFPDTTSNVKQISTYEYVDDSGYGKLPIFRKLAVIGKVALGVAAITKSCDSDEYIQVFYGLNGAAPTTSLGYFKNSPMAEILTFGGGLGTEFYTIQLALKLFRGSTNTNSPELESLLFYYIATPETISGWTFNIEATSENAEALITALEAIRDTATLVVFNPTGDPGKRDFNYNVKLTTMPMRFYVENQQTRQGWITVDVQQIFNG